MAEVDFVELLNAEGISYETTQNMPSPNDQVATGQSLTHTIAVYGDFDDRLGRQAGYDAYVDDNGTVVLIEHRFAYVAPGPCLFGVCL